MACTRKVLFLVQCTISVVCIVNVTEQFAAILHSIFSSHRTEANAIQSLLIFQSSSCHVVVVIRVACMFMCIRSPVVHCCCYLSWIVPGREHISWSFASTEQSTHVFACGAAFCICPTGSSQANHPRVSVAAGTKLSSSTISCTSPPSPTASRRRRPPCPR